MGHSNLQVPDERKKETGIHLLATAGLRLLKAALAESILESCRQVFLSTISCEINSTHILPQARSLQQE